MRTAVLLTLALGAPGALLGACTVADEPEGYDVTLSGDSKSDEIGGLRVRWEVGETHDWFSAANPELGVLVARRGGTLMLLAADVAELRPLKADNTANYTPTSTITVGITSSSTNVELLFALADGPALADGRLNLATCGGSQMFKSLAINFARSEVLVDGTKTVPFAMCGITLDAKDPVAFKAKTFALLGVPVRTTDGSMFAGTYRYKHTVTVR